VLFVLTCACRTPASAPRDFVQRGPVRAPTVELATSFARLLDELQPLLAERLPGAELGGVRVDVRSATRGSTVHAVTSRFPSGLRRIRIEALAEPATDRYLLAHELVHAALGSDWSTLPGMLEEGLAEALAFELAPEAPVFEARHVRQLAALTKSGEHFELEAGLRRDLELDLEGVFRLPDDRKRRVYAFGTFFAEWLGPTELVRLCASQRARAKGRIPADEILRDGWRAAARAWSADFSASRARRTSRR